MEKMVRSKKVNSFLSFLKKDSEFSKTISTVFELPSESFDKTSILSFFSEKLIKSLQSINFSSFYTHQIDAFKNLFQGKNVLISTPTGSGKSLVYQLYAIDSFLRNKERTFLFLYPYKALAQDQFQKLTELSIKLGFPEFRAEIYDGDTPSYKRKKFNKILFQL